MANLKLQTGEDNPTLRKKCEPVKKVTKKELKLIKEMEELLKEKKGLGLAAPQVGENIRLCIVRLNYNTDSEIIMPLINPRITSLSDEKFTFEEGCLSLPDRFEKVTRPKRIELMFMNKKGDIQTLVLNDLNAVVVQHEIDHLDGILFVDRI